MPVIGAVGHSPGLDEGGEGVDTDAVVLRGMDIESVLLTAVHPCGGGGPTLLTGLQWYLACSVFVFSFNLMLFGCFPITS